MTGRRRSHRASSLQAHEQLFLNPFTKWKSHGIFPLKFALNVLLVALTAVELMAYLSRDIEHYRRTLQHFSKLFTGAPTGTVSLTNPDELRSLLNQSVYYTFFVDEYSIAKYELQNPEHLMVHLKWRNGSKQIVRLSHSRYVQDEGGGDQYLIESLPMIFGPTRDSLLAISKLSDISINIRIREPEVYDRHAVFDQEAQCYAWFLTLTFDSSARGEIISGLDSRVNTCNTSTSVRTFFWLHCVVVLIASICLLLVMKRFYRSWLFYRAIQRAAAAGHEECLLTPPEKRALFSKWWVFSAIAHSIQIAASALNMDETTFAEDRIMMLGWSNFFSWLMICQYFEHFPSYYSIFGTMSYGGSNMARYMISVMPVMSAFAFLGIALFWKSELFGTPTAAYASLFSLLNGDLVHDSFIAVETTAGSFAHIYIYVFSFIFIYIVLNANLCIIEEAFFKARSNVDGHENFQDMAEAAVGTRRASRGSFGTASFGHSRSSFEPVVPSFAQSRSSFEPAAPINEDSLPAMELVETFSEQVGASQSAPPRTCRENVSTSTGVPESHPGRKTTPARCGSLSPRLLLNPRLHKALAVACPSMDFYGCGSSESAVDVIDNCQITPPSRRASSSTLDHNRVEERSVEEWISNVTEWVLLLGQGVPSSGCSESRRRLAKLLDKLGCAAKDAAATLRAADSPSVAS